MRHQTAMPSRLNRKFLPDPSRYEIESNVGEGLNASVFKAIRVDGRERSRQPVALKFLKDRTAVDILRREFETLSKVRSQYCARVMAWESCGDDCALVLEWIDGPTLFDLAQAIVLTESEVDEILSQLRKGLRDLREMGLHHGDLHPGNVMIDSSGVVRLLDFGNSNAKKSSGMIQGCPSFLSPEIWRGETTSFESDLFALAVIEKGLVFGFNQLSEREEARGIGLFAEEPRLRLQSFLAEDFDSTSSTKLADTIQRFREKSQINKTCVVEINSSARKLATVASNAVASVVLNVVTALAAISGVSIPVQAEAPLMTREMKSSLSVSTTNWAEITLNGKKVGYAPLVIRNLRPGNHRLMWKSAFGSGEMAVQLQSDEVLRISEADLRATKRSKVRNLSTLVNH
ncbi:MAG: hypothetical protein EOP05_11070 [Proteobacteria bacterium]|nr:MAG: hypothetical protein EOP05_11070 [Pseudomonadota bacterium]